MVGPHRPAPNWGDLTPDPVAAKGASDTDTAVVVTYLVVIATLDTGQ